MVTFEAFVQLRIVCRDSFVFPIPSSRDPGRLGGSRIRLRDFKTVIDHSPTSANYVAKFYDHVVLALLSSFSSILN